MARFAGQQRSSPLRPESLPGLAHVAGPDPEDRAPPPFAGGETVDGSDVHARIGQLLEIVGERTGAIVALDQETGLLGVEPQPGFPRGDLELPRVVGDDIDPRAATLRKTGAGEQVDAGAHERRQHLEGLPRGVGDVRREVIDLADRVAHRGPLWNGELGADAQTRGYARKRTGSGLPLAYDRARSAGVEREPGVSRSWRRRQATCRGARAPRRSSW